jgi:CubicO group peptidase (beta-lactamase class C family)
MIAERVVAPEQVGLSAARLQRIDRLFEACIEHGVIAGAVALVARHGQVAHLNAYGLMDLDARRPMQRDTIFRLASMTKPVISVAILMLLEEGKLLLTEPVSKFLPVFRDLQVAVPNAPVLPGVATQLRAGDWHLEPAQRDITIRDLLTHTSGLGSALVGPGAVGALGILQAGPRGRTLAEVVPEMAALPLSFQPGAAWEYSPAYAFDTLGHIVELVSGIELGDFLRQRVFEPLAMRDTDFSLRAGARERLATLYDHSTGSLRLGTEIAWLGQPLADPNSQYRSGGGGLVGTADDYGRFCMLLANGGRLDDMRLLSRKTVDLMAANHIGTLPLDRAMSDMRGMRFGLGVRVVDNPAEAAALASRGTFGWAGAYGTNSWIDPVERMAGVMLVQCTSDPNDMDLRTLWPRFQAAAYQALDD